MVSEFIVYRLHKARLVDGELLMIKRKTDEKKVKRSKETAAKKVGEELITQDNKVTEEKKE